MAKKKKQRRKRPSDEPDFQRQIGQANKDTLTGGHCKAENNHSLHGTFRPLQ